ncbi:MAG: hypothetical protein ABJE10_18235 [bacterium]
MSSFPIARVRQICVGPLRLSSARAVVAALGVMFALAACSDATAPLATEGTPDELTFSIGGFGVGTSNMVLRGDTIVLQRIPWDWPRVPMDSVRVVPSSEAWRVFWAATERAGVSRWQRHYAAAGFVDGTGWDVHIVVGGRVVESSGSNAYPDGLGHEHQLQTTDDFQAFVVALGDLAGRPLGF